MFKKLFAVTMVILFTLTLSVGVYAASSDQSVYGSTTGTGAAINISLGFTPSYVIVTNPTSTNITQVEWSTPMLNFGCLKTTVYSSSTTTAVLSYVTGSTALASTSTGSCIGVYSGSTTTAPGFTIGPDTNLNVSGQTLYYKATR